MKLDPVQVTLDTPIQDFGQTIRTLEFNREINGGDLLEIDGLSGIATTLKLIHLLAVCPDHLTPKGDPKRLSFDAVKRLTKTDIEACAEALGPFAGVDPKHETSTNSTDSSSASAGNG